MVQPIDITETLPPIALDALCKQMGISRRTAWKWRFDGDIKAVNIHGRWYILAADMAQFNRKAASGQFEKTVPRPGNAAKDLEPKRRKQRSLASA